MSAPERGSLDKQFSYDCQHKTVAFVITEAGKQIEQKARLMRFGCWRRHDIRDMTTKRID
jgi:hypothetical protein